ncbi:MAG: flagellar biosynthetic protein FliR [Lachnospiraceae bacterium]|nr:flagellar biosynthetic protein FliR [Lachnospiraceae bacterium]MDE7435110.1 flagellar biosynthetic protein FliR [Lachnospiraceae bacterium]
MVNYSFSLISFEYFLLILVRVASFVSVAPFFSTPNTPGRVKVGFSLFTSILLLAVLPVPERAYTGVIGYAIIIVQEGITGLLIGFGANICNSIVLLAGNIIDLNIGLSMATEFDPITRTQAPIAGTLYNYLVLLLLMSSGMERYLLRAVADSFELIPVNGQVFHWDSLLVGMLEYMANAMILGFRIALPVFAVIMILNCLLGIMAKVAPQMNMFAVGIQMKLLVGLAVIFLTFRLLPYVADFIMTEMRSMVVSMVEGLY